MLGVVCRMDGWNEGGGEEEEEEEDRTLDMRWLNDCNDNFNHDSDDNKCICIKMGVGVCIGSRFGTLDDDDALMIIIFRTM